MAAAPRARSGATTPCTRSAASRARTSRSSTRPPFPIRGGEPPAGSDPAQREPPAGSAPAQRGLTPALPLRQVPERDVRRGDAAHTVDASARWGRRGAEIDAAARSSIRDELCDGSRVELAQIHQAAVDVAADEVAVARFELRRAERAARENELAETGCEAFNLCLDRVRHI